MYRTIISLLIGATVLSVALFSINMWFNKEEKGVFLTQDTYMGTITWYEDSKTPPVPSEFSKSSPLIATETTKGQATDKNSSYIADAGIAPKLDERLVDELEDSMNVLNMITAGSAPESDIPSTLPVEKTTPIKSPPTPAPSVLEQKVEPKPVQKASEAKKRNTNIDAVLNMPSGEHALQKAFLTKDTKRPIRIQASAPVTYKAFYLSAPERIVIDIQGRLSIENAEALVLPKNAYAKSIRVAYNNGNTRIVMDLLKQPKIWAVTYGSKKNILDIQIQN